MRLILEDIIPGYILDKHLFPHNQKRLLKWERKRDGEVKYKHFWSKRAERGMPILPQVI